MNIGRESLEVSPHASESVQVQFRSSLSLILGSILSNFSLLLGSIHSLDQISM